MLRAPKRTQPARRADGREKEEEVAVVEEGEEKERRLNRRAERKVREAATPAPANININNNNRSAARCIRGWCSSCASLNGYCVVCRARGGGHRCVCRDYRERSSEPKSPKLRQIGEIWALLPYYRPPSILNEEKEVSTALLPRPRVHLRICVLFLSSSRAPRAGKFHRGCACVSRTCVPCHWHMATNARVLTVVGSQNATFIITPIFISVFSFAALFFINIAIIRWNQSPGYKSFSLVHIYLF